MSVQISDLAGKVPEGFVERIQVEGECWRWVGSNERGKNAMISIGGKRMFAKIYAWELFNNRKATCQLIRQDCCKEQLCVNPEHFYHAMETCPTLPEESGRRFAWIPGHHGYLVSDDGVIFSYRCNTVEGVPLFRKNAIALKTARGSKREYQHVVLHNGKEEFTMQVHQAVMLAFVGSCPSGMQVLHADDDPGNNKLENLRYGTCVENSKDAKKNGRIPRQGSLTDAQVIDARKRFDAGESQSSIAESFGVALGTICLIVRGKTYFHLLPDKKKSDWRSNVRRISPSEALEIRSMVNDGISYSKIAKHFGVTVGCVQYWIRKDGSLEKDQYGN